MVRTLDLRLLRLWFDSRTRHCLVISEIGDHLWQVNILGCNHHLGPQPRIPLGLLIRVPALAGVKVRKSPLPQVTL